MTGKLLDGRSVLIVEDEFFLAEHVREMLEDGGATVVGPFSNGADALLTISADRPDCALVDVNLGQGPCFDLTYALIERKVPVILTTGYDAKVLPPDLSLITCLPKPLEPTLLLRAVNAVCRTEEG